MSDKDPRPFLVLTVLLDSAARPAAITTNHGDALERGLQATAAHDIAGLDLVELTVAAPVFKALRQPLSIPPESVGLYDIFPLASHLDPSLRKIAAQFLAAEALWTLEEQGLLSGVPVNLKLDVPAKWDKDPKAIHKRLVEAGALELSPQGIDTYKAVKATWDQSALPS